MMTSRTVFMRGLVVLLTLFVLIPSCFARFDLWENTDGVAIRQGHHVDWVEGFSALDGEGHYLVTWCDAHTGSTDIYARLFSYDGTPVWDQVVVVANGSGPEQEAQVVRTSDNNWLITWLDCSEDVTKRGFGSIYAQKIDNDGNFLWEEPLGPIGQASARISDSESYYSLVPTLDGGGIVIAQMEVASYVRKIGSDGNLPWGDNIPGFDLPDFTRVYGVSDGMGGVILTALTHVTDATELRGRRIDTNGNSLWEGGEDGQLLTQASVFYQWDVVSIGEGRIVVALDWNEAAYQLQLFNADGSRAWGDEGYGVSTEEMVSRTYITLLSPTDILINNISSSENRTVQRYDITGEAPQQVFTGCDISFTDGDCLVRAVLDENDNLYLLSWRYQATYPELQRFLRKYASDGSFVWEQEVFPQEGYSGDVVHHLGAMNLILHDDLLTVIARGAVDNATGMLTRDYQISDGTPLGEGRRELITGVTGLTGYPCLIKSGTSLFTVWTDSRSIIRSIYCQRLDVETGESEFQQGGINIFPGLQDVSQAAVTHVDGRWCYASDDEGGFYVALHINNTWTNSDVMYLQHVNSEGELLLGDSGLIVDQSDDLYQNFCFPGIARLGDHSALVIYSGYNNQDNQCLLYNVLQADGTLLWDTPASIEPVLDSGNQTTRNLFTTENSDIILVTYQQNYSEGQDIIKFIRVNHVGEIVWETTIQDELWLDRPSVVLANGTIATMVRHSTANDYRLILISQDGTLVAEPQDRILLSTPCTIPRNGIAAIGNEVGLLARIGGESHFLRYSVMNEMETSLDVSIGGTQNLVIPDVSGGVYLIGPEYGQSSTDLYYKHINRNGLLTSPEYEEGDVALCTAWFCQEEAQAIPDGEGGFFAAWNDFRGSQLRIDEDDVYGMHVNDFTSGVGGEFTHAQPLEFTMQPAYPNPFNPSTTVFFTLPEAGKVQMSVYDILGREVVRLLDEKMTSGSHCIQWNGCSFTGQMVASGSYFIELRNDNQNVAQRVFLLK